jgi:hypothetical protein
LQLEPREPAPRTSTVDLEGLVSVATAVDKLLGTLELDEVGEARAEIARALAQSLDSAARSASGAALVAGASCARELRAVLDEILDSMPSDDPLLDELLGKR